MRTCIFVGPTLAAKDAHAICPDAVYLPPVRQGDVYRVATRLRPDVIAIVDGFFSHVPSVWHKEILYAMSEGITVYGTASMGALRAAELAQFAMIGVGRIFEAYRDGILEPYEEPFEDDDEVAVLHGPAELDYVALSEALVNIRCTLARAAERGIIKPATRDALVRAGKALFYQERSYEVVLGRATNQLPAEELERLRAWLPGGKVDQKRDDTIAMLQALQTAPQANGGAQYALAETTLWERAKGMVDSEHAEFALELVELRLQGAPYLEARARALDRLLDPGFASDDVLQAHHVPDQIDSCGWATPDMSAAAGCARARELVAAQVPSALVERYILAELRTSGASRALCRRAAEKRQRLARLRFERPVASGDLLTWYFGNLGTSVPADLEGYVRKFDFPTLDAFHRILLDEYLFLTASDVVPAVRPSFE